MQKQSRVYGFEVGENVVTSPAFDVLPSMTHIEGVISGITNDQDHNVLFVLDANGSTHRIAEINCVPPNDWQERTKTE